MRKRSKRAALPVAITLAAFLASGCGSGEEQDKEAASPLHVVAPASGALRFVPDRLFAPAGSVAINFDNLSKRPHSFCLVDPKNVPVLSCSVIKRGFPGPDFESRAPLRPGTYTYYCKVDGHRAAGMEGTLTVG